MEAFSQAQREFKTSATLSEAFVEYRLKMPTKVEFHAFIPYEDLTSNEVGKTEKRPVLLLLSTLCLMGLSATVDPGNRFHSIPMAVFFGFFTATLAFAYFWGRHKLLALKGKDYDVCVLNNAEGRRFLDALRERRKTYMRMMYGRIRWENPVTQELGRFQYLNTQGILSDAEYEAIRVELMNK